MISCLLDMKAAVEQAKPTKSSLSHFQVRNFRKLHQAIIEEGYLETPLVPSIAGNRRGREKKTKPRNLLERLDRHRCQVESFLTDLAGSFRRPVDVVGHTCAVPGNAETSTARPEQLLVLVCRASFGAETYVIEQARRPFCVERRDGDAVD